jgi:hypothetical protein
MSDFYAALSPVGPRIVRPITAAHRPASLRGKTIGFLWNGLFRGDETFPILAELLTAREAGIKLIDFREFGLVFGGNEQEVLADLPRRLHELGVDAVIVGVGCCGACTPAVMRASSIAEGAGVPSVSLVCDGFIGQGRAVSGGFGIPNLPIARIVGHVDEQDRHQLRSNLVSVTVDEIVQGLTQAPAQSASSEDFPTGTVIARGSFEEINRFFLDHQLSDGLPIVPPTEDKVNQFFKFTPDQPSRIIGPMRPSGFGATVFNVAVNGVMANCRPEYMPVLIAIAEALCDPAYGVEHSGDTTGGEALVILSGEISRRLGFAVETGVLRDGVQANTSTGRFVRLLLRNVARSLPGGTDKSTFGNTWRVVLAEHEDAARALGWPLFSEDRGYPPGTGLVTVGRFTGGGVVGSIYGRDPEQIVAYLADGLVRQMSWESVYTVGFARGTYRPLLVLSPMVARTLTRAGVDKARLRAMLFQRARMTAERMETYIGPWTNLVPGRPSLIELTEAGKAAAIFAEDNRRDRLVPIVERPEDILIVVSGDPLRSNAYAFASNGPHGFPTTVAIRTGAEMEQSTTPIGNNTGVVHAHAP